MATEEPTNGEPEAENGNGESAGPKNDAEFATGVVEGIQSGEFTSEFGTPSELLNPYVSPEEQDMEMESTVVGPGSYASPNPESNAGRLRPIEDHPLADGISEDYGADVNVESEEAEGEEEENNYSGMTKQELVDLADEREVEVTTSMTKDEVIAALKEDDEG